MKTVTVNEVKQGDVFTLNNNSRGVYVVNVCLRVYPKTVKVLRIDKSGSVIDFIKKDRSILLQFNLIDLSSLGAIYNKDE